MDGGNVMKKHMLERTLVVWFLALICCLLWGSAVPSIKIGYKMFEIAAEDSAAQILFAGIRFFLAGVLTVVFGSLIQRQILIPGKKEFPLIVKLALFQTILQYVFFYLGLAHTSGVKSAIIVASNVFFPF